MRTPLSPPVVRRFIALLALAALGSVLSPHTALGASSEAPAPALPGILVSGMTKPEDTKLRIYLYLTADARSVASFTLTKVGPPPVSVEERVAAYDRMRFEADFKHSNLKDIRGDDLERLFAAASSEQFCSLNPNAASRFEFVRDNSDYRREKELLVKFLLVCVTSRAITREAKIAGDAWEAAWNDINARLPKSGSPSPEGKARLLAELDKDPDRRANILRWFALEGAQPKLTHESIILKRILSNWPPAKDSDRDFKAEREAAL